MIGKLLMGAIVSAGIATTPLTFDERQEKLDEYIAATHPDLRVVVKADAVEIFKYGCSANGGVQAVFVDIAGVVALGCADGTMIH